MEYNEINENVNLATKESVTGELKNLIVGSEIQSDIKLTNEQKLEYISNLIQNVDREFEVSQLKKKIIKQQRKI